MSRKTSAIILGMGMALGVVGVGIYVAGTKSTIPILPISQEKITVSAPKVALATWTDQAGFTFQYPQGLSINKHDEDTENYAHIELTAPGHPGSIIVWAKDSAWDDIEAWVKGDSRLAKATIADTTFAQQAGKKAFIAGPPQQRIEGTISDAIVFTVEGTLADVDYWSPIQETIAGSFAFTSGDDKKSTSVSNDSSSTSVHENSDSEGDSGPVDEEEVLQ